MQCLKQLEGNKLLFIIVGKIIGGVVGGTLGAAAGPGGALVGSMIGKQIGGFLEKEMSPIEHEPVARPEMPDSDTSHSDADDSSILDTISDWFD